MNAPSRPLCSACSASHCVAYDRTTSFASSAAPSWNVTPWRSVQVHVVELGVRLAGLGQSRFWGRASGLVGVERFHHLLADTKRFAVGLVGAVQSGRLGALHEHELGPVTRLHRGEFLVAEG